MSKKIDDKSEAKQRIRQFFKDHGIDLRTGEKECGFGYGYLSTGGVVGSDKLAKFITAYPDADLYYIVTGEKDRHRKIYEDFVDDLIKMVTNLVTKNKR